MLITTLGEGGGGRTPRKSAGQISAKFQSILLIVLSTIAVILDDAPNEIILVRERSFFLC